MTVFPILRRQMLTMRWLRLANGLNTSRDYTAANRLLSFLIFIDLGMAVTASKNLCLASSIRLNSAYEFSLKRWDSIWVVLVTLREIFCTYVFILLDWQYVSLCFWLMISCCFCLEYSSSWEISLWPACFSSVNRPRSRMVRYFLAGVLFYILALS